MRLDENTFDPQAGQRGTKALAKQYGELLVCVRFKYDAKKQERIKTVELIVERAPWTPPVPRYAADSLVPLRIRVDDIPACAQAKAAGGRWRPDKQLSFVKYGTIAGTTFEKHIYRCFFTENSKWHSIYMNIHEKHLQIDAGIYL